MKIAMLGHKRIPTRSGGVEVVVEELSTRMVERGHSVTVCNRHTGEEKMKEYKGVKVLEIPTFKRSGLNAMLYSFLATFRCLFGGYDIIHYHAEGQCVAIPLSKIFGKRVVATIHGLDWQRGKWGGFATKYLLFGEKMAAKYADKVIVLSNAMQRYFKDTYNRDTELIPNGVKSVNIEENQIIKEKYGLNKNDYILFLARITTEKGLHYLIEAYKQLNTDKKLVIAGELNPETEYIAEVKELAKDNENIMFVGFKSGKEYAELFSNCYLYVLPSDIEGMPMSLLEAVEYNARVLTSDIPENTEFLYGYGTAFKCGDVEDLKDKLSFILANPDLREKDFKADKTAEDIQKKRDELMRMYNWDTVIDKTLALYEETIKRK